MAADVSPDLVQPLSPPARGLPSKKQGGSVGGQAVQASSSSLSGTSLQVMWEGSRTPGEGGSAGSEPSSLRGGGAR